MKNAFTLAEVLVTLVIVGIIAAITIPAVVTKATNEQYVTGLKKAHNTLKTLQRAAILEHGEMKDWGWDDMDVVQIFETYFKPHFDILRDCGTTDKGCFGGNMYKMLDNKTTKGTFSDSCYKITTSDGMIYALYQGYGPGARGTFYVDVNGQKGPNILGRDLFGFDIFLSNVGIKPAGAFWGDTPEKNPVQIPNSDVDANCHSNSINGGYYCTVKVLAEGAMNY